ncbi:nucleoside phosphatase family-domain-containing protein [Russula earlei]|uniref:Nucleoside phosphatase family-domain-containing protein n=1 Tax=Russula earlei TaxID=71964 RepID=A0ACC0UAU4_9AGAM|nr:nucleoside phosphatase family-domain-containing protein [Russula earlei]
MISPQSSNYERLEGGLGPSRLGMRNIAWRRIILCLAVSVVVVLLLRPSPERVWNIKGPIWDAPVSIDIGHGHASPRPTDESPTPPVPNSPQHPRPSSHESDPDPSKTVFCAAPHSPSMPLVQYALMIDAGSTGSRIHVYKFHHCGPSPVYEYETFVQKQPGLSAYAGRPDDAAQSLDSLLDVAMRTVPEALRRCTPVAVKATAGLRLLGASQSADILDAVRRRLSTAYPFPLESRDPVAIMDGRDEGVFAWVTANYLMDTIRADSPRMAVPYAVLDLGGASTQIVFEPVFRQHEHEAKLREGEHRYELSFGGKEHVLYQHSYLGYGLMRARKSVHRLVDFVASLRNSTSTGAEIANPCLARGTRRVVEVEVAGSDPATKNVTMFGGDFSGFEACNDIVQLTLAKDAVCQVKPCSFDGVYQPSLMETFRNGKVLLLSYFYDRISPLLPPSSDTTPSSLPGPPPPKPLTVSSLAELAKDVCLGLPSWEQRWAGNPHAMQELADRPEYCLDLTYMYALLRSGYEIEDGREVEIGKQVDGTELGWALGAAIAMVGGELTCTA